MTAHSFTQGLSPQLGSEILSEEGCFLGFRDRICAFRDRRRSHSHFSGSKEVTPLAFRDRRSPWARLALTAWKSSLTSCTCSPSVQPDSASTSSLPAAEPTSDDLGPRKLRLLRRPGRAFERGSGRHSKKLPRGSSQRAPPSSKRRAAGVPSPAPHVPKHHRSAM
jgi:hypothetical protein